MTKESVICFLAQSDTIQMLFPKCTLKIYLFKFIHTSLASHFLPAKQYHLLFPFPRAIDLMSYLLVHKLWMPQVLEIKVSRYYAVEK